MSSSKSKPKEATKTKPMSRVGSRKELHSMTQGTLNGFFHSSATRHASSSRRGRSLTGGAAGPSGASRPVSAAPLVGTGGKTGAISALKDSDRSGRGARGSSPPPLPRASGSKLSSSSSNTKKKREAAVDIKGKGKAKEIIELISDDENDEVKKEDDPLPIKKRRKLSDLHRRPTSKNPLPSRHGSSSLSPPPQSTSIIALPPEAKRRRSLADRSSPAPESFSPPHRGRTPPSPQLRRSKIAGRSSTVELSASLAGFLPDGHPSPPSLYRPTSTQELAEAEALTGLKDGQKDRLKYLQRRRFDHETDALFEARRGELRLLEEKMAEESVNNSMRPTVRAGWTLGGPKDLEKQRLAREKEKERVRLAKERRETQRSVATSETGQEDTSGFGMEQDRRRASSFVVGPPGSSKEVYRREQSGTFTPTISSLRPRLPASRPRHNPSNFAATSTPLNVRDPLSSSDYPPSSRQRPAPPPVFDDPLSLSESQFAPIAKPPPRVDQASPTPSPRPSSPLRLALSISISRPPPQHRSSDDVGDSQWSAHDYYNPDPPRNPFVDHPIPLSDLLPVNPTIPGTGIPELEDYETQLGEMPETQFGAESAAGWSAFEAVHVYRPGRIFERDPSRNIDGNSQQIGPSIIVDQALLGVATDSRPSDSSQTQPSSQNQPPSSQIQVEHALQEQPLSPEIGSSRVLVAATPSPTSARSSSPDPARPVVDRPRSPLQPRQITLLHEQHPSSSSQDGSSGAGDFLAFLGRSPGSLPVRDFVVARDDSSSGPGSGGGLEVFEDQEMTPKGKNARRAMLEEIDGEAFKNPFAVQQYQVANKKLAGLLDGSNKAARTGTRTSPIQFRTGSISLMGPPAPRSPKSPRKGPPSPVNALTYVPFEGSPLRPRVMGSLFSGSLLPRASSQHSQAAEDEDDELVPETQSEVALPLGPQPSVIQQPKRPSPFQPVLLPMLQSASVFSVASSSKPKRAPVWGGFTGFPVPLENPEEKSHAPPSATKSKALPRTPAAAALAATTLDQHGFTSNVQKKALDREARADDEDVSASEDEDAEARAFGWTAPSSEKGKGMGKEREMDQSSPFVAGGKVLKPVPSPPPLPTVKPAKPLRRRGAVVPTPWSPETQARLQASLGDPEQQDASDNDSYVSSSQTQAFPPRHPQPPHSGKPSAPFTFRGHQAPRQSEDDQGERIPSSHDLLPPGSPSRRSGLVEERDDQQYETDDERVPASDVSASPISFNALKGRMPLFFGRSSSPLTSFTSDEPVGKEEEEEDGDATIVGMQVEQYEPASEGGTSSSFSSVSGVETQLAPKFRAFQDLLSSSNSSFETGAPEEGERSFE